jgi:nucleoside-diphosphate-sugar epimerase
MSKLIFGCGYLGMRVATRWASDGATVLAVTRDIEKSHKLRESGILPVVADIMDPGTLKNLPQPDTVLFAVGHDRRSGRSIRQLYVDGLQHVLDHLPPGLKRLIYVSSTGVYGQSDGAWVDEQAACAPTREGGQACRQAELLLQSHPLGERAIILRMAGIYGPDRIPRRKELQSGLPIEAPSEGYLNLIHVDDAARIVMAAEERAPLPALYCVSDGHPVIRREYFHELAALLGAPKPTFRRPRAGSPAAERAGASKRVSNRRMLAELGVELQHPSYREGLAAIVQASLPSSRK